MRQKTNLPNAINAIPPVQSRPQKDLASRFTQITSDSAAVPAFHEGRIAIVTDAGWNAVDVEMPFDERHARVRRSRVVLAPQISGAKSRRS